jgi:hypothetical protein
MKKPFSTKINEELINVLKELSEDTRIPMARLLEEAIKDLIIKHRKEVNKK